MREQSKLQKILEKNFPDTKIKLQDLVGYQNHYSLVIEGNIFNNKAMVA
ncbi:MAG: stress-induced morphogen [Rickettsiales bacterium]|jgi:stress-induced morphogen